MHTARHGLETRATVNTMSIEHAKSDPRSLRLASIVARGAAGCIIGVGLLVLCGVALLCLLPENALPSRRGIGLVAAAIVVAIGVLRLIGLRSALNLHIDQLLFPHRIGTNVIAPNTAAAFVLTGTALLML